MSSAMGVPGLCCNGDAALIGEDVDGGGSTGDFLGVIAAGVAFEDLALDLFSVLDALDSVEGDDDAISSAGLSAAFVGVLLRELLADTTGLLGVSCDAVLGLKKKLPNVRWFAGSSLSFFLSGGCCGDFGFDFDFGALLGGDGAAPPLTDGSVTVGTAWISTVSEMTTSLPFSLSTAVVIVVTTRSLDGIVGFYQM